MILTANFIAGDTELSPADKVAANFISVRASRVLRRAAIVREPQQGGLRRRKEFLGQWPEVLRGGGERLDRALGLVSLSCHAWRARASRFACDMEHDRVSTGGGSPRHPGVKRRRRIMPSPASPTPKEGR
jgi:hypothetical protein